MTYDTDIYDLSGWMLERQKMYIKMQFGARGEEITKDHIMQKYRFCNVFREQDKTTQWLRKTMNILEPFSEHVWFMPCIARRINHIETLESITQYFTLWDWVAVESILDERKYAKKQIYSEAYSISTGRSKMPKNHYTCKKVLETLWRDREKITAWFEFEQRSLQEAWQLFCKYTGFGPFFSYEVISDLRWHKPLKNAPDILTWAHAGPGAVRGLNRVFNRPVESVINQTQAVEEMRQLLDELQEDLPPWFPDLEMRDVEHSLCEFDKYMRTKLGEGRPKQLYRGYVL